MSASTDHFSADDDDSFESFDELEFMRNHMNDIGYELYEKTKMPANAQAKIVALEDELGIRKPKAKKCRGYL
jgi:hypothetical protein